MNIAILSGKGGVGKTFASVNLAMTAARVLDEAFEAGASLAYDAVQYIDCDAEAPNGALFLADDKLPAQSSEVTVHVPVFDAEACTGCRGCAMVCSQGAVSERDRVVGTVERMRRAGLTILSGRMNIGESSSMPIVRQLLAQGNESSSLSIVDCPPGTACSAAECVKEADYCLIVAEPSDFGVHNLGMAFDLVSFFRKPCSVLINKSFAPDNAATRFCEERGLEVIATIPFDRSLARKLSRAGVVVDEDRRMRDVDKGIRGYAPRGYRLRSVRFLWRLRGSMSLRRAFGHIRGKCYGRSACVRRLQSVYARV